MSSRVPALLLLFFGAWASAAPAGADSESGRLLHFNPFERPELGAAGQTTAASRSASARVAEWRPILTATLVAEERALANLGGVVLEVGESTHGYRLVEVREFEAVFQKGEEQVVLPVTRGRGLEP